MGLEPPKIRNSVSILFDNSVKHILRRVAKSVKNGDGDFSEQFALFLINQKNKINNTL